MKLLTILILFLVVVGYLFIGAAVFQKLEADNEQDTKTYSVTKLAQFLDSSPCVSRDELEWLIRDIITAYKDGVDVSNETESTDNWNFGSSFFFSATVVTTIGYGHISPSTWEGRLFCILYALVGIPIAAVFFAGIGQKLQKLVMMLKRNVCCPAAPRFERVMKSLVTGLLGLAILILLPAFGFHNLEEWTYMESVYYCVITITTIGFGDFVPGQQDKDYRSYRQVVTIIWIFIGLSWISMLLSEMGEYLSDKVRQKESSPRKDNTKTDENGIVASEDGQEKDFTPL